MTALANEIMKIHQNWKKCPNFSGLLPVSLWIRPNYKVGNCLCLLYRFIIHTQIWVVSTRKKVSRYGVIYYRVAWLDRFKVVPYVLYLWNENDCLALKNEGFFLFTKFVLVWIQLVDFSDLLKSQKLHPLVIYRQKILYKSFTHAAGF